MRRTMEEASKPASEGSPAAKRSRAETELPEPPGFHPDGPVKTQGKAVSIPGGMLMPTYVNLLRFTDQGVRNYQDTVDRAEAYWGSIEKAGGRLLHQVWTMGDYDIVMLFEAPDDETATSLALGVSSLGNVRTTTMRAFAAEEMRGILERGG